MLWSLKIKILEKYPSQLRFARVLGISPATLSLVLNEHQKARPKLMEKIAAALECPVDELFRE